MQTMKLIKRLPIAAWIAALLGIAAIVVLSGLFGGRKNMAVSGAVPGDAKAEEISGDEQELLVTGYCNCGKCCGWRKKWFFFGQPVYNYGKMKGTPKKVGVTASGTVAAKGTIAADPAVYPFGTKMQISGYGSGSVQDIGGSIKGTHIDIWFPSHDEAVVWGARRIKVKVAK